MKDATAFNREVRVQYDALYPYASIGILLRKMAQLANRADHAAAMPVRLQARVDLQRLHGEYIERMRQLTDSTRPDDETPTP